MKEIFISSNTSFIIYGAGEVGNTCFQALKANGFQVIFALDKKRQGNGVIEGVYTYQLGNEPSTFSKPDSIVVVCLANGLLHKEVADELYKSGYPYIIFLPMQHCISDKEKRMLTNIYNKVLVADTKITGIPICPYEKYNTFRLEFDNGVICENGQWLTVLCGLELLFSESMELWKGDKGKVYTRSEYKDKNIAAKNPCKHIFDFFDLQENTFDFYFDARKKELSAGQKNNELQRREKLYRLYKREYNKGMDFFIEGAPSVIWNQKKYFNLIGGHHRTLFLLHKGHSLFPVKMSEKDFEIWCNKEMYKELLKYISEHQIKKLYAPLPHPGFLNFPSEREDGGNTMLEQVMRFFSDKDISQMSVMDCMDDEAYFARNMARIGAKKSVFRSNNIQQLEIADLCCKLLYREDIILEENINVENDFYDIVFGNEKKKNIVRKNCF